MTTTRESTDVIIIGGGVIGLSCAYRLARAGHAVALYERGQPGQEASRAALGVLNPKAAPNVPAAYTALEWASLQHFPALAEELLDATGMDIGLNGRGVLHALFDETTAAQLPTAQSHHAAAGIPTERLTAAEARERQPALDPGVRAALYFSAAQNVDNVRLCAALAKAAQQAGAQIYPGQPVQGVEQAGGRVTGVRLRGETRSCGSVIVAAGSWSGFLDGPPLPVEPVKGQALTVDSPLVLGEVLQCDDTYIVPRRDGGLMIGASVEHAGFDQRVTVGAVSALLARAAQGVPTLTDASIRHMWAGLRPRAADDLPVLGPVSRCAGLHMATGHFRNGILLAPITAHLMTEWLGGEAPDMDVTLFSPDRWAEGE